MKICVDALVIDISLVNEELIDFLMQLRSYNPKIGFIGVSSLLHNEEISNKIALAGISEYPSKPFEPEDLQKKISKAIEKRKNDLEFKTKAKQPRILVVDDEEIIRKVLTNALELEGYHVDNAMNVSEALKKIQSQYYHIVISDLRMEGINGIKLTSAVRLMDSDTIIIIITGYPDIDSAREAVKNQVYDYLLKPIDPEDLNNTITRGWEKFLLSSQLHDAYKDIKQKNQELRESTAQLIQSEKLSALGELTANLSHEMRQPLNIVRMSLQLMLANIDEKKIDEKTHKIYLQESIRQIDRMNELIKHVNTFSRKQEVDIQKGTIQVNSMVETIIKIYSKQFTLNNIQIIKNLNTNIPDIDCNSIHIEQVLINLLTNARNAVEKSTKEQKEIRISTNIIEEQKSPLLKDSISIEVVDNGVGIPEHLLSKIFDSFFTTKPPGEGTGLGLSISKKIIEAHKGIIELDSKTGEGTTFKIILPVIAEDEND